MAVAWGSDRPVLAQLPLSSPRITNYYCHIVDTASEEKTTLRQAALAGDATAQQQYNDILQNHADALHRCRTQNWPKNQAIWVRLYPCDVQVGRLEQLLDEFVDLGYNHVYLETFYNGQVLLPQAENDTPWPSVVRQPGYEHRDLLAEAIAKGHERGLQVYAWMFTMNFGRSYANHSDRQQSLAQNGYGQTSISLYETASLDPNLTFTPPDEAFIDPYNRQAKLDFYAMSQKVLARQPDGILFDYIRYPVGLGADLVANDVEDLWIYGESSQQALLDRALNPSGRQLIQHFLEKGHITEDDVSTITEEPLWQGRQVDSQAEEFSLEQQRSTLQADLWKLAVSHAVQGVLDFLNVAELSASRQQVPAGAVFFPEGNRILQDGYDSRLQPWDQFPSSLEWHPMSYGICGDTSCITAKVQRVIDHASEGTNIKPVLAGVWGRAMSDRPSLEAQMQDIRRVAPQIDTISHFAYSWQRPDRAQERQFCQF
ncbi:MAG: hypothetical protein F6K09_23630 [Merismopedia sp. SIO2A8]|nr:hypothetical protein [Merismopedia sp. SIO2A8]